MGCEDLLRRCVLTVRNFWVQEVRGKAVKKRRRECKWRREGRVLFRRRALAKSTMPGWDLSARGPDTDRSTEGDSDYNGGRVGGGGRGDQRRFLLSCDAGRRPKVKNTTGAPYSKIQGRTGRLLFAARREKKRSN